MKIRDQYIIDAIATYVCIQSIECGKMISSIDVTPIADLLDADYSQREKGLFQARKIIRDFMRY